MGTNTTRAGRALWVIKPFRDADGDEHPIGQEWIFVSTLFSKFDDELTLCIRDVSGEEWKIPLIWKPDRHMDVIENWQQYLAAT